MGVTLTAMVEELTELGWDLVATVELNKSADVMDWLSSVDGTIDGVSNGWADDVCFEARGILGRDFACGFQAWEAWPNAPLHLATNPRFAAVVEICELCAKHGRKVRVLFYRD